MRLNASWYTRDASGLKALSMTPAKNNLAIRERELTINSQRLATRPKAESRRPTAHSFRLNQVESKQSMPTRDDIMERLRFCYDPEIPLNIVDLGLIYGVQVEEGDVVIEMTLTAPGCPSHNEISQDIRTTILNMPGVNTVKVNVVWDPPWDPSRISPEGREKLGIEA